MKHITILHANDIHGQLFFRPTKDFVMHGGISMLADYVRKTRKQNTNTFFGICGDILQEDITGSDYKGTNTVALLNSLNPEAVSLGNHELDYGLAHLLIFKQCLRSPIINANIMVEKINHPLFEPSKIFQCGNVKLLIIGLIPEDFFKKINSDEFCRNMLSYKDSYTAIKEEIEKHKADKPDLTIIMSHYGIDGDKTLIENMPEDCHIDLVLGGHTHIDMDKPEIIKGIPIAQSSYGTTHIGRFEIDIDEENGGITNWNWERVEINSTFCDFDMELDELADTVINTRKKPTVKKKLCDMSDIYKHESRLYETELGDIVSDAFKELYDVDLVILQSGSIRSPECPKELYNTDLHKLYPFDDEFLSVELTGKQIKSMFNYLFTLKADGSVMNGTFQYSKNFKLIVDGDDCFKKGCKILEMQLNGKDFEDDKVYTIGVTKNCFCNFSRYFNIVIDEANAKLQSLSTYYDLAKWFLSQDKPVTAPEKNRFKLLNFELS